MPKPVKSKKPLKPIPKVASDGTRRAVRVVAFIADCHSVRGTDVKDLLERKPELFHIFNIKLEEVTHQTMTEADAYNRQELAKLVKRYGANKLPPVPKEYSHE